MLKSDIVEWCINRLSGKSSLNNFIEDNNKVFWTIVALHTFAFFAISSFYITMMLILIIASVFFHPIILMFLLQKSTLITAFNATKIKKLNNMLLVQKLNMHIPTISAKINTMETKPHPVYKIKMLKFEVKDLQGVERTVYGKHDVYINNSSGCVYDIKLVGDFIVEYNVNYDATRSYGQHKTII